MKPASSISRTALFGISEIRGAFVLGRASFGAAAVRGKVPVGEDEGVRLGSASRKAATARGVQAVRQTLGWVTAFPASVGQGEMP